MAHIVDLWVEMTNPQVALSAATNEKPFSFQFILLHKKQAEHEYDQNPINKNIQEIYYTGGLNQDGLVY